MGLVQTIKSYGKLGALYSIGSILQNAIYILLFPLATKYLSVSDYGIMSILLTTISFIVPIISTPITLGAMRYYHSPEYGKQKKILYFNVVLYTIILSSIVTFVFLLFPQTLSGALLANVHFAPAVLLFGGILFLTSVSQPIRDLLRMQKRVGHIITMSLISSLLSFFLIIYLLTTTKLGVYALIYGKLLQSSVEFFYMLPLLYSSIRAKFNWQMIKDCLAFGAPLIFVGLSLKMYKLSDNYLLRFFDTVTSVGLYSVADQMGSLILIILVSPLSFLLTSFIYPLESKPNELRDLLKKIADYFYIVSLFLWLGISLAAKDILIILASNRAFIAAWTLVPILAFAHLLTGLRAIFSMGLMMKKKSILQSGVFVVSAIVKVALGFLLIPFYGIMGAAISLIVSVFVLNILLDYYSRKHYQTQFNYSRLFVATLLAGGLYGASMVVYHTGIPYAWLIKYLALVLYPLCVYFLPGVLSAYEKAIIRDQWAQCKRLGLFSYVRKLAKTIKRS